MNKVKKILFISFLALIIIFAAIFLSLSPLAKYLIEKYDTTYTGRQITLDLAYVNPFTGYVYLKNLKIYEHKSDSVFLSADGLSAHVDVRKLFLKTYEIRNVTLDHPRGIIIQNQKEFNFDDLIDRFSSSDSTTAPNKAPLRLSVFSIKINDGKFYYLEKQIPINYFIKKVNIESYGFRWDKDTMVTHITFLPGIGTGNINGSLTINLKNLDYYLNATIKKLDLNIIDQYLKDLTNYGEFRANLDADLKAKGNFKDKEKITTSGIIAINDFHFGKNLREDYVSFDKLKVSVNEVNPKNHVYNFDSVLLIHPYFKYERYDHLDNVETVFGKNGANVQAARVDNTKFNLIIEIGRYIKAVSKNFFRSPYKVNRLAIDSASFMFNDYSISEKFAAGLSPLSFAADSIEKSHERVTCFLNSGIKPYGKLSVAFSINPKDSTDFDLQCQLQNIPIAMFNPYVISFTSFPLDRGTLEFNAQWHVINGVIKSNNHLVLIDPRVSKRLRNKDTKWIPVPLIMAFIRERGNVIDYEIPITGDLKNPKFHFGDVIIDLVENIFVKPPTTPYRIKVKNIETEIEKSLNLKWQMRQDILESKQKKFVKKMANFIKQNPDGFIRVYKEQYATKEKEYILFFEAKKKYFLTTYSSSINSFSSADSEMVDKMSVKDSLFINYLNKQTNKKQLFTIQEKCAELIDSSIINTKFNQLNKRREANFISFFKIKNVEKRVKFTTDENVTPYNGFSFYKITYKNEFPEFLLKAYRKINELNDVLPRKKFKKEHQKSIDAL